MSDSDHKRTIIHFDIDCFYAQVEMIRNPSFRDKPLGIQQKNILVTCNYEARQRGLTKLMYISEARKKCSDLIIVNGEDLTHYRNMSYRISDFIQKYTPLVERLGFDENFVDVTDMVEDRMKKGKFQRKFSGHMYDFGDEESSSQSRTTVNENVTDIITSTSHLESDDSLVCSCGCFLRMQVGSQIAADIREGLKHELQITCCAGIAHNKLLAKLVGSTHKPNQQTSILPHLGYQLVSSLQGIRSIPGIGSSSTKRLKARGIDSIWDLQQAQLPTLEKEFGKTMAKTFSELCFGIDNTPVVSFSAPQTISDEDSFKCCNELEDVKRRARQLVISLLQRLKDNDSRIPATLRLTVRGKDYVRNSRQCPIPANVFKCKGGGKEDEFEMIASRLMPLLTNLLHKLVDVSLPFHLTLINVCFAKLIDPNSKQNTLDSFFTGHSLNANGSELNRAGKCSVKNKTEECFGLGAKSTFDGKSVNNITGRFSDSNVETSTKPQNAVEQNDSSQENINESCKKECKALLPMSPARLPSEVSKTSSETKHSLQVIPPDLSMPSTVGRSESKMASLVPDIKDQSLEILKKLLPKHIDACEVLQLPGDIQSEVLLSFGISTQDLKDGQKTYFLMNKVSTRSQQHSQNSCTEQNKSSNQNLELSRSQRKPLFSPRKRKAENEKDLINISTNVDKGDTTSTSATTSPINRNTVYKRVKCDNDEIESDLSESRKVHVKKEEYSSFLANPSSSGSSSIDVLISSIPPAQSPKMSSPSVVMEDHVMHTKECDSPFFTTRGKCMKNDQKKALQFVDPPNSLQSPKPSHDIDKGDMILSSTCALIQKNGNKSTPSIDFNSNQTGETSKQEGLLASDVSVIEPAQKKFSNQSNSTCSRSDSINIDSSHRKQLEVRRQPSSDNASAAFNKQFLPSKTRQCPSGIDPDVFYSLPPNIQGEILAHDAMGTGSLFTRSNHQRTPSNTNDDRGKDLGRTMAGKSNVKGVSSQKDIFDYFKKK